MFELLTDWVSRQIILRDDQIGYTETVQIISLLFFSLWKFCLFVNPIFPPGYLIYQDCSINKKWIFWKLLGCFLSVVLVTLPTESFTTWFFKSLGKCWDLQAKSKVSSQHKTECNRVTNISWCILWQKKQMQNKYLSKLFKKHHF